MDFTHVLNLVSPHAREHVCDARRRAHTKDREFTDAPEFGVERQLFQRHVKQSTEVDVVRLRLDRGVHHIEV